MGCPVGVPRPVENTMTPAASGSLYNYGAWVRDFNINTAGVKPSDLAISARLFDMDTENPESTDFITKSSGELYISDTFVGENGNVMSILDLAALLQQQQQETTPAE